jgi:hypothetical protein
MLLAARARSRTAMFADDQDALISAWQPGAFPGCGPVNPGAAR